MANVNNLISTPPGEQQSVPSFSHIRFFIIKKSEGSFSTVSPFLIQKSIQASIGNVKSTKKLRSGDLLVEVSSPEQAKVLFTCTSLGPIPVSVQSHTKLNQCRGVISESDLFSSPESEILENLKDQRVSHVHRITIRREGKILPTKHLILTFDTPSLPSYVTAAYLRCKVRPYIPNPIRCFKCQRFGHGKDSCRGSLTCARCAQVGHDSESCKETPKCVNCKEEHPSYSPKCPKWLFEKEIQSLKATQQISYLEARRIVETRTPTVGVSYAAVTSKSMTSIATQTDPVCVPLLQVPVPSQSNKSKSRVSPVPSTSKQSTPVLTPTTRPKVSSDIKCRKAPHDQPTNQLSAIDSQQATCGPTASKPNTTNQPTQQATKLTFAKRKKLRRIVKTSLKPKSKNPDFSLFNNQQLRQLAAEDCYLQLCPSESEEDLELT